MSTEQLRNGEAFLRLFDLIEPPYMDIKIFQDKYIGFSVKREYPKNIRFKPAKTKSGKDDVVALIKVTYGDPKITDKPFNPERVPIIISIIRWSIYKNNHFDYHYEDNDCPTEESLIRMNASSPPENLDSYDEYFYSHTLNQFITNKGKSITGKQILDKIFEEHINTIHLRILQKS
ncbi:MAG: hypothetical protein WA126_16140 [Thermodesulfovibrionales bacterium]